MRFYLFICIHVCILKAEHRVSQTVLALYRMFGDSILISCCGRRTTMHCTVAVAWNNVLNSKILSLSSSRSDFLSAEEYFLVSYSYVYFALWQLDKQSKFESYQVCFCLIPPCFNKIISDLYFCIPDELCYVSGCIRSDFQYCYPCFSFKSGRSKGDLWVMKAADEQLQR